MISLNADLVRTLFLMRDGRTVQGFLKVCEQFNSYDIIDVNAQTGEQVIGRRCTLVLQDLDDERFLGVDYAVGTFANGEPTIRAPWVHSIAGKSVMLGDRNLMVELKPLDKIVVTTYRPKAAR